ncbi:flagellar hook-length control protein FliK [Sphingomonas hylomeconis]|uniref:Flagellar hook-length control protein FliK n=1 Tax=Sphingomonas hylomeconis TaxID=1395958 RepID=A0ABV7SPN2_9SPHN|nr:flagellar hook-length control protein FliK [Sphingomonas hylomeconis]
MIDAATSVSLSPPPRPSARAPRDGGDDFRTTLETVAEQPTDKTAVVRLLTGRKPDDAPALPEHAVDTAAVAAPEDALDTAAVAAPRTCGTSWRGKRPGIAGDGKTLPATMRDDDERKDPIWLPIGVIAPLPAPATCPLALPRLGGATVPLAGDKALALPATFPAPAGPSTGGAVEGSETSLTWAPAVAEPAQMAMSGNGAPSAKGDAANDGIVLPAVNNAAKTDLPVRPDAPAPTVPQAMPQPAMQPATQPAGQVFAAAIAAAVHAAPRRDEDAPSDARAPLAVGGTAMDALRTPVIAAPADARQNALDLGRDSGLQGMIDHIEVLRDNADAGDTRIRLVPDALGAVDVSVRKDGERVHVHFSAENAASARLLSEAQPRLADLAEARGVKLGQTSVDSQAGNARQQPQQQTAAPPFAAAPVAALRAAAAPPPDNRIA